MENFEGVGGVGGEERGRERVLGQDRIERL